MNCFTLSDVQRSSYMLECICIAMVFQMILHVYISLRIALGVCAPHSSQSAD